MSRSDRDTIFVEDARVLEHREYPGEQFVIRLSAPETAARARAGSFVHLRCDADIPMRRPLSIMRAQPDEGWVELLYKIVGAGLKSLSRASTGDRLNLLGPIGNGFDVDPARPRAVLIGGGVGIPPLLFLAETLAGRADVDAQVFFGSELPFPFALAESQLPVAAAGDTATHSLALLENWGIPGRLASAAGLDGCYPGFVTELARAWLDSLSAAERNDCLIYACGPEPMLLAAKALASNFSLPAQLCLEEFMACAVGGCAGCAVRVDTPDGPAMRRVCVDGPVFDGASVYNADAA
jgi:dihydroorotate dehydrogenase electron transfer subunit